MAFTNTQPSQAALVSALKEEYRRERLLRKAAESEIFKLQQLVLVNILQYTIILTHMVLLNWSCDKNLYYRICFYLRSPVPSIT